MKVHPLIQRMTPSLKMFILREIAEGKLVQEDALRLYNLSEEELNIWKIGFEQHGFEGLKIKTLCQRRKTA